MMKLTSIVFLSALIMSCAQLSTSNPRKNQSSPDLARVVRRQNDLIQNLQDENVVLKRRIEELQSSNATAPVAPTQPVVVETATENAEHYIYAKIISSYRARHSAELHQAVEMLAKGYPQSVHLDNAYYLLGLSEIAEGHYTQGEVWFDRVLNEQPMGNKAVSALFAKAIAEKRLNHFEQAHTLLQEVQKLYPGSAEAQRSVLEIKLLNAMNDTITASRTKDAIQ
jgi:TolA-binding protein